MSELLAQALLTGRSVRVDVDVDPGEPQRLELRRRLLELEEARAAGRWREVARLHEGLDAAWAEMQQASPRARVEPEEVLRALGLRLELKM